MSRGLGFLLILFLATSVSAQEEDCPLPDNKKAVKNWKQGLDRKKNKKGERIQYLMDAIKAEPEFAQALWAYSEISIKDARRKGKLPTSVKDELETVIAICPQLHSSPYFYLAEIAMNEQAYGKAASLYKAFIDFKSEDDDKFDRRHDELFLQAKANYKLSTFFNEQFNNPKPFNPVKVNPVSTAQSDEYLPLISPDNELMLFTRRDLIKQNTRATAVRSNAVNYVERFSSVQIIEGKPAERGKPLPPPFNEKKEYNYGGSCLSIQNDEIFVTICINEFGKTNCDIYTAKQIFRTGRGYEWTPLEPLGPEVNTPEGWEAQPTLSRDGNMLLFATLRKGETKGIDIYQTSRDASGNWSPSKSIGEPINTDSHEKTPFFHSDSRTLYFASKGHLNFGGYDVFKAKLKKDGTWTEPMNLGYPVNTASDEHGYVVSTDGKTVYYASKMYNGTETDKVNIYKFPLYKEARPEKVILMKGKVATTTGTVPKKATLQVRNSRTDEVESFDVDTVTGSYTAIVTVEDSSDFVVSIKGEDVAFNSIRISGKDTSVYKKLDVPVEKSEVGKPYAIDDIVFKTNSAELLAESKVTLESFAAYLRDNPTIKVSIEGHTDNVGDPQANLVLSTERAYSVLDYLQEHGVYKGRLKFKGYGDSKPIANNSTAAGRAKNRRTEFVILSK